MAPKPKTVKLDFKQPEVKEVKQSDVINHYWWKNFNDPTLNKLINRAIKRNLDIRVAVENIKSLEAQFTITSAMSLPQGTASTGYSRNRAPSVNFMTQEAEATWSNNYSLQTGLRFEIDLWGKLKNMERAAVAHLMGAQSDLKTLYLSIISRVAMLYYDLEAQKHQIILTKKSIGNYQDSLEIQENRYEFGKGSSLNVSLLTQTIAATKMSLEQQRQQFKLTTTQLKVLLGDYPTITEWDGKTISKQYLPALAILPKLIPSKLLKERSDIIAATHKIDSAREMIGYAKADRFPSFSLSASLGYQTQALSNLFSTTYLAGSAGANVQYNVFDGGSKEAVLKQKKIAFKQAEISYQKTVLNAFKEVEDALIQIHHLKLQKTLVLKQIEAAQNVFNETEKRYLQGSTGYTYDKIIDARRSLVNAHNTLISIEKGYLMARIQLHLALGGNWFNPVKKTTQKKTQKKIKQ